MLLQELIDTFEELKLYVFVIDRGEQKPIVLKFKDDNFYHLVGLHKTNIDMFIPSNIKSKKKKYKFIKRNVKKYNNILINQSMEKDTLKNRLKTFHRITDLLKNNTKTTLYSLKFRIPGSIYNGDFGLLKIYEQLYCLLGLKCENETEKYLSCVPQSWMASKRINILVKGKRPIYMKSINIIPKSVFEQQSITI